MYVMYGISARSEANQTHDIQQNNNNNSIVNWQYNRVFRGITLFVPIQNGQHIRVTVHVMVFSHSFDVKTSKQQNNTVWQL